MNRIIFFGNGLGAIECVKALKSKKDVDELLIVTPKGKYQYWHTSLKDYCIDNSLDYICPSNVNTEFERFKVFNPDIIFSAYYTQIISDKILNLASYAINFHPSLLPKYRGTAPLIWAIVKGESKTGITAHEMTKKIDSGKIFGQEIIPIEFEDTGISLYYKAIKASKVLFDRIYSEFNNRELIFFLPEGKGSYYSNSTPRVNELKPNEQTRKQIYDIVRALTKPLPGAYLIINNEKVIIYKVQILNDFNEIANLEGKIFIEQNGLNYISAIDGYLKIIDFEII